MTAEPDQRILLQQKDVQNPKYSLLYGSLISTGYKLHLYEWDKEAGKIRSVKGNPDRERYLEALRFRMEEDHSANAPARGADRGSAGTHRR